MSEGKSVLGEDPLALLAAEVVEASVGKPIRWGYNVSFETADMHPLAWSFPNPMVEGAAKERLKAIEAEVKTSTTQTKLTMSDTHKHLEAFDSRYLLLTLVRNCLWNADINAFTFRRQLYDVWETIPQLDRDIIQRDVEYDVFERLKNDTAPKFPKPVFGDVVACDAVEDFITLANMSLESANHHSLSAEDLFDRINKLTADKIDDPVRVLIAQAIYQWCDNL